MNTAAHRVEPGSQLSAPHGAEGAAERRSAVELVPWLPCTLALDVPVSHFTVRDLLELRPGTLVETSSHQSSDIPMRVNGLLMAWTEFEVIGERLAARITDLA